MARNPVQLVDYRPEWPGEAQVLRQRMARVLGDAALRIEHIGSTAVPGLAAKNILDLQVELKLPDGFAFGKNSSAYHDPAEDLAAPLKAVLESSTQALADRLPLERLVHIDRDHIPFGARDRHPAHWCKAFMKASPGRRNANVHLRFAGAANARFAVLVRDYLRAHPHAAQAYGAFKRRLADGLADAADYPEIKDPVADLLWQAAQAWSAKPDAAR